MSCHHVGTAWQWQSVAWLMVREVASQTPLPLLTKGWPQEQVQSGTGSKEVLCHVCHLKQIFWIHGYSDGRRCLHVSNVIDLYILIEHYGCLNTSLEPCIWTFRTKFCSHISWSNTFRMSSLSEIFSWCWEIWLGPEDDKILFLLQSVWSQMDIQKSSRDMSGQLNWFHRLKREAKLWRRLEVSNTPSQISFSSKFMCNV